MFWHLLIFFPTMIHVILFSATLNYSTGIVLMTFTETIDVPLGWSTTTNLQHVHLQNNSAPSNNGTGTISMQGAFVTVRDSHVVEITLVEEQRARAIALSGVVGGDGASLVLDMFVRRQVIPRACGDFFIFIFFSSPSGLIFVRLQWTYLCSTFVAALPAPGTLERHRPRFSGHCHQPHPATVERAHS